MVTLDDYNDDSIAACRSVLVEAFTVLGRHRRHLVLEKDAYDIYFCLANYPGGIDGLVKEFQSLMDNGLVRESLARICGKFRTIDSIGPVWAAQVVQSVGGDYEFTRRDAFERANALFDASGVQPWLAQ